MDILKSLLQNAISSIEKTTELLYQQNRKEGYEQLNCTLELIMKVVRAITQLKQTGQIITIEDSELLDIVSNAMKALEDKDEVLLSDILEYELKEMFIHLLETLD